MHLSPTIYDTLTPVVEQAVRATSRRWSDMDPEDLRQFAWLTVLESLPTFDPSKGKLVHYMSRILKRSLPNEARRTLCPVRGPRNKEHTIPAAAVRKTSGEVADAALLGCAAAVFRPDVALDAYRMAKAAREAVAAVTRDQPEVAAAVLSGGDIGPRHLAAAFGGAPEDYQAATRRVYQDLRGILTVRLRQDLRDTST